MDVPLPRLDWTACLVAFAQPPFDARSACIAAVPGNEQDPHVRAAESRLIGAPLVFVISPSVIRVFGFEGERPQLLDAPAPTELSDYLASRQAEFSPDAIYRAKTRGRADVQARLPFVDAGWMPYVESQIGEQLAELIEDAIQHVRPVLEEESLNRETVQSMFQTVFWLVAAKLLKDKDVPAFRGLDLTDVRTVFARVAAHYGCRLLPDPSAPMEKALARASKAISRYGSFALMTSEALAYVYEKTLVDQRTRDLLGIHSTPSFLTNYIVDGLATAIEKWDPHRRVVFEPACGHAGFLAAAVRLLASLEPDISGEQRATYLRTHVSGFDIDPFAVETARLCLTIADVPNSDNWPVVALDIFKAEDALESEARKATVLLSNPPFGDFKATERVELAAAGIELQSRNKAAEMLARTLPHLPEGAALGVIVPRALLANESFTRLRETLLREFILSEVCLLPDNVFRFSDAESAVILAVKGQPTPQSEFRYRIVREEDARRFERSYTATTEWNIRQMEIGERTGYGLALPQLAGLWEWLRRRTFVLDDFAVVGQGFAFKGTTRPQGAKTVSNTRFAGAARGFSTLDCEYTHHIPREQWLNTDPDVIQRRRHGMDTGIPQVLFNAHPIRRGPWRLKAIIDQIGRAVRSTIMVLRPRDLAYPLEFFWALLNSPIANAYTYCHSRKRDINAGEVRALPVPAVSPRAAQHIADAAAKYISAVSQSDALLSEPARAGALDRLLELDAHILALYGLRQQDQRELLALFTNQPRPVPVEFRGYDAEFLRRIKRIQSTQTKHKPVKLLPGEPHDIREWADQLIPGWAEQWLRSPSDALGGRVPVTMIGTEDETELRDLLLAATHGIPS